LAWLLERTHAHKPDLLIIGPVYEMTNRDLSTEDEARRFKNAINVVRDMYNCAIILEHHAPHKFGEVRELRPIGSSLLMRWPSFGFGLVRTHAPEAPRGEAVYRWQAWRGGRDRERSWPEYLREGKLAEYEWPWMTLDAH
jgi:hypothetical protein